MQNVIFEIWSLWNASCVTISLCVSFFLISVIKLWDMIICLCMCKGRTHHVKFLESNSHFKLAKTYGFFLHVTLNWQSESNISDEMCEQNLIEWCHTCHRESCQCARRIDLNYNPHAQFIHLSNCITLRTDVVHMVEILEIACGMSRKSRWRSWIRNGEEVELYLPKTSEMI